MANWHCVGRVDAFEVDFSEEVTLDGQVIAVHPTEEGFFATSGICTHEDERIFEGLLDRCQIECPKHMARFDVRTGAALSPPAITPLLTYQVELRDDYVWVNVPVGDRDDTGQSPTWNS
ncbi:MAG: non-heme iron oxygenase ferredoxin subunit [Actinomycetota bacterium]|nr:non-heme iron oxygenase ferredoxin subunit [Actinomycetota bacterium]